MRLDWLSNFAAEAGPPVHLTQAPVLELGPLTVTNTMLYGWISIISIIIILFFVGRSVTVKPKAGVIQLFEIIAEFISSSVENAFNNKQKARKYVPYFVTLFFFILLVNWLGLLPFTREAILTTDSQALFKPWTASFNATLAMAAVTMMFIYYFTVKELGLKHFFGHFFVGSPKNPLFLLIGIIEMMSDAVRVVSLSLRLFLNVVIGEILIAVFAYLGGVLAPVTALPFFIMELLVLALQAYIFVILAIMYLSVAVNDAEEPENLTEGDSLEKIGAT